MPDPPLAAHRARDVARIQVRIAGALQAAHVIVVAAEHVSRAARAAPDPPPPGPQPPRPPQASRTLRATPARRRTGDPVRPRRRNGPQADYRPGEDQARRRDPLARSQPHDPRRALVRSDPSANQIARLGSCSASTDRKEQQRREEDAYTGTPRTRLGRIASVLAPGFGQPLGTNHESASALGADSRIGQRERELPRRRPRRADFVLAVRLTAAAETLAPAGIQEPPGARTQQPASFTGRSSNAAFISPPRRERRPEARTPRRWRR